MTNLVGKNGLIDNEIDHVSSYKRRDNQPDELERRIGLTWAAFGL